MDQYVKDDRKNKGTPEEIAQQLTLELCGKQWGLPFLKLAKINHFTGLNRYFLIILSCIGQRYIIIHFDAS